MKRLIVTLLALVLSPLAFGHGNQSHSKLGDHNNVNNCNPSLKCEPKVIYKTKVKVKYKTKVKKVRVRVKSRTPKNSISLIGGASPTKLKVDQSASGFRADTEYEPDAGLMYQRDFGRVRGTAAATIRGSFLLGVGYNW